MSISPTRIVDVGAKLLVGNDASYSYQAIGDIPGQWHQVGLHMGNIPGQTGGEAYGISYGMSDGGFRYFAGFEVDGSGPVPPDLTTFSLPPHRYAVFAHAEHVSKICLTIDAIHNQWLPSSGEAPPDDHVVIEVYGPHFDPQEGKGDIEIWYSIC